MAIDRLGMLEQMVQQRPEEPFPRYGLALEYQKYQRIEDARREFEHLLSQNQDYLPTYLMAGNFFVSIGERARAGEVYRFGIVAAEKAGDEHTRGEIEDALSQIPASAGQTDSDEEASGKAGTE